MNPSSPTIGATHATPVISAPRPIPSTGRPSHPRLRRAIQLSPCAEMTMPPDSGRSTAVLWTQAGMAAFRQSGGDCITDDASIDSANGS